MGKITTIVDVMKTFIPTLVLHFLFPEESYDLLCAVAVLIGHLWPIWYSFRGGGGNASIIGMLLAISPLGLIATHVVGMLIGRIFPMVAFLGGVVLTVPWFAWRNGILSPETVFALTITLLYISGQLPEALQIRRLRREGHTLDIGHVMGLMKKSAASGESGAKIMADASGHTTDNTKDPKDSTG